MLGTVLGTKEVLKERLLTSMLNDRLGVFKEEYRENQN